MFPIFEIVGPVETLVRNPFAIYGIAGSDVETAALPVVMKGMDMKTIVVDVAIVGKIMEDAPCFAHVFRLPNGCCPGFVSQMPLALGVFRVDGVVLRCPVFRDVEDTAVGVVFIAPLPDESLVDVSEGEDTP